MVSLADYSPEVRDEVKLVREQVATLHAQLTRWNLVVWTAGNVSQRLRSA
ncbi:MAG: L-ribulose-5-phosphate 4-epimerase, partial [Bifidobacterium sp.]|nr:L-ribulose-5-phosphate 4-epimerase [Bifidobacterium sp.]